MGVMNSKPFLVTGILSQSLLILAVFCLLLIVASYFRGNNKRAQLKEADARVLEVRKETIRAKDEKGELKEQGPFRIVYVEFETGAGGKTSARLKDVRSSEVSNYPIGSTIPIQYSPEFPERIREVSFLDKHGLELVFGIFGVVFLLGALMVASFPAGLIPPVSGSMTQMRIAGICVFFGLLIVGFAMWSVYVQSNSSGHETTIATVTGYESVTTNHGIEFIYPVLQFQTSQGRTATVRSQSQIVHAYDALGSRYPVIYSAKDPVFAIPASADGPIAGSVFMIFIGLFPLGIGGVWLFQLLRN